MAEAPLVAGDTAAESGAVVVIGGQVTVGGSCAATAAAVTPAKHGTIVRARWESCGGVTGTVRLRAVIEGDSLGFEVHGRLRGPVAWGRQTLTSEHWRHFRL
jgi:hypothetical protein